MAVVAYCWESAVNENAFNFDRGGVFYPAVMSYWISLHGLFELLSRGMIRTVNEAAAGVLEGHEAEAARKYAAFYADEADRTVTKIFDVPNLETTGDAKRVTPPTPDELTAEIFQSPDYVLGRVTAGGNLLVAAAAAAEDFFDHDDPMWEFLRHCRNAAAHGGRFRLKKYDQPKQKAEWRGLEITAGLERTKLFKDGTGEGLLAAGDPFLLLLDLEKKHPQMQATA